jgi:RHS repeat-associated protein
MSRLYSPIIFLAVCLLAPVSVRGRQSVPLNGNRFVNDKANVHFYFDLAEGSDAPGGVYEVRFVHRNTKPGSIPTTHTNHFTIEHGRIIAPTLASHVIITWGGPLDAGYDGYAWDGKYDRTVYEHSTGVAVGQVVNDPDFTLPLVFINDDNWNGTVTNNVVNRTTVVIRGGCKEGGRAGDTDADVASLSFKIDLGAADFGRSGAELHLYSALPNPGLSTPLALSSAISGTNFILKTESNAVRQVLTPAALIHVSNDTEDGTAYAYTLRFYPRPTSLVESNGLYVIDGGAVFFKEIIVTNPAASPTIYTNLIITENSGDSSRQTQYTYNSGSASWTLKLPNDLAKKKLTIESSSSTEVVELRSTYKPGDPDQLVYSERNKYKLVEGERFLIHQVIDPDGAKLTNTFEYYETSSETNRYKKPKQKVLWNGYWEKYDYGVLYYKKVTPFNNSSISAADNQCRVLEINYADTNPYVTTTETVLGEVVSKSFKSTSSLYSTIPYEIKEIQCLRTNAVWNDSDNLVTTTLSDVNRRIVSTKRPDGTLTTNVYSSATGEEIVTSSTGQPNGTDTAILEGTQTVTTNGPIGELKSRVVYPITGGTVDTTKVLEREIYTYGTNDIFKLAPTIQYLDGTTSSGTPGCCGSPGPDSTTDKDGSITYYSYDDLDRLTATETLGITTTNILDAAGQVLASVRIGTNGSQVALQQTAFDLAGRAIKETNALSGITTFTNLVDSNAQLIKTNSLPDGGTRIETYYRDGSLAKLTGSAVHPVRYTNLVVLEGSDYRLCKQQFKLDASGNDTSEWTKTYYDMVGRPYKTVFASASGTPASLSFYNNKGQLERQVDPDSVTNLFVYNAKGELELTAIDLDNNQQINTNTVDRVTQTISDVITNATYGTNMLRTRAYVWGTNNNTNATLVSTSERSLEGLRTWNTVWNGATAVVSKSQIVYTNAGNRYETNIAPDSSYAVSVFSYGRLSTVTSYSASGSQLDKTTYGYDEHGRVKTTTDARNGATIYAYNNADQVTSVTTPAPGTGRGSQAITTYYDNMGRATIVDLSDGTSITNEYHPTGELKRNYGARTYPVGYGYDAQGRMTKMTNWTVFPSTGERVTTWNYDGYRGFLTNKVYAGETDTTADYEYTSAGRLWKRHWERGVSTTNSYNFAGDLQTVDYSDSTADISFGYDRRGRQTGVTNGTAVTSLNYNDAGQLLTETNTAGTLAGLWVTNIYDTYLHRTSVSALASSSQLLSSNAYAFDNASRLTNVTDGTYSAGYGYLANSPLMSQITLKSNTTVRMTTIKAYDFLNRLQSISSAPGATNQLPFAYSYQYNDANQRTRMTLNDGSFWIYQYDALGQVKSGKKYWSDSTPVAGQQFEYGHDDIGNRDSTKTGGDATGSSASLRSASYTVNSLNQYSSRDVPGAVDVLGIANANASVTVNSSAADYRRGEYFQELLTINNGSTAQWQSVTNIANLSGTIATNTGNVFVPKTQENLGFDADGNQTNDGRWSFTWDAENRLTKLESVATAPTGSKRRLEFEYDWRGRRVRKKVTNLDTSTVVLDNKFLYDGWNIVAELNATNNGVIRSYIWGTDLSGTMHGAAGVGGLVAIKPASGNPSFVACDGNGNVTGLIDAATGTTTGQFEYGPFGETIRLTPNANNQSPFRFSTKYQEDESDFLYYGFRYYNPSTGRWLSRDPIDERGGVNLYGFAGNHPTANVDVLGRYSETFSRVDGVDNSGGVLGKLGHGVTGFAYSIDNVKVNIQEKAEKDGPCSMCCLESFEVHQTIKMLLPVVGDYLWERWRGGTVGVNLNGAQLGYLFTHENAHHQDMKTIGGRLGPKMEADCNGKCLFRRTVPWSERSCKAEWEKLLAEDVKRITAVTEEAGDHFHDLLGSDQGSVNRVISQTELTQQKDWVNRRLEKFVKENTFCPFASK